MRLYGTTTSPYVRKIRALAAEKGLACPFAEASAWDADSPVAALNPLGKVPVLVLDNGTALFDSPVIAEWLDGVGGPKLLPASGPARIDALRWQALADGLMDATVAWLLESRRSDAKRDDAVLSRQHDKISRTLAYAEARAPAVGAFLVGDGLGLADLALCVAVEYVDFRHPHDWRAACPRLDRWHAAMRDRPSLASTRPPG